MEKYLGLLRLRIKRGINLAIRDISSSDPYVVVTMGDQSVQKFRTVVIQDNCNPEWNQDVTLPIKDIDALIHISVYDKDTFTLDDKMGEAHIDLKPYASCLKMGLTKLPDGCVVKRVQPAKDNCLSDESHCVWNDGTITQEMTLKLQNVERGEIVVELEWLDVPGCKGLARPEL